MNDHKVYELAEELYFYFIEYLDITAKCVVQIDDKYTENTDLGREIYHMIEDEIMRNMLQPKTNDWKLLGEKDIKKRILKYVKHYNQTKLH